MKGIYEDKYHQKASFGEVREKINSKEQIKKTDFYLRKYENLKVEIEELQEDWNEIQDMYEGKRETENETDPNCFVNAFLPTVEGQVSSLTQSKVTASFRGKGYSDRAFARTADILMRTVYNENKIRQKIKRNGRRYILFGNCVFGMSWNTEALDDFGLPEFRIPSPTKVFVDGKIKDPLDLQKAEFIIEEIGYKSIMWARKEYGDEIAEAIELGNNDPDFEEEEKEDDKDSFTLLHVWTRNNKEGNLQLLEISKCGILCRESDPNEPYYKYVHNKYPYAFANLYPREGNFYAFGDGKLLKPIQEILNQLYDQIIIACKFSAQRRTFVDPRAEVNPYELDNDPSHPVIAKNPREFIYDQPGQGINQVVFMLVEHLFAKIQEMTRFSSLMTGNKPKGEMTATQAGIQASQGVTGIDDKKSDLSSCLSDMTLYALALCMEFWSAAKALRISEDEEEFEWIDARQMSNVPVSIPVNGEHEKLFKEKNPNTEEIPNFMLLEDETGPVTKQVEFDVEVSIGEGIPTNKMAIYNIILSLSQLQLPDSNGMLRPLLTYEQVKQTIEDTVGIKIDDNFNPPPMMGSMDQQKNIQPTNMSSDIPGADMNNQQMGGMSSVPGNI